MRPATTVPSLVLVAFGLAAAGCPQGPVAVIPNNPPLISIEEPIVGPSGDPIVVEESEGLRVVAVVDDAEDELSTLVIHWYGERTDTTTDVLDLGDTQPDTTGWSEKIIGALEPGRWSITAEVEDANQATDSATIPVEVLSTNDCPGTTITQPLEGAEFVEGEVITFVGTVNDDRGLEGVSIEWFDNLDGLLDITPPTDAGLLTFSRSNLTVGEHLVVLTATDSDGSGCPTEVGFDVLASNNPPYPFLVEIDPQEPSTLDELHCLITQGSADPEGQPITYAYTWYADGVPTLILGDTVGADQTINLQDWTCEVVASDGVLQSEVATDAVTIGNTPPTFDQVILLPDPAYETSTLVCAGFGFEDVDGDPEGWVAAWTVDALAVPGVTATTLDGTWFDKGQEVFCDLSPFDGFVEGESMTSSVVTIGNSPPTAPGISVSPAPAATVDSDIECLVDVDSVDPDGDVLLFPASYEVSWLVNTVAYPDADDLWILPSFHTALGDTWTCQIRVNDGEDWGDYGTASTDVLPLIGDIVISEFHAAPSVVPDVAGEWIEVYNASGTTMSLLGFELHDDGTDTHIIGDDIAMPPGTYVVLARNGDYLTNGSVLAAYEYTGVILDDVSDEIVLTFDGVEVDRVEYDLSLYPAGTPGHSLGWDPDGGVPDPVLNDDTLNWCHSGTSISVPGTSDFGTPGGANDPCACFLSDSDGDGWGDDAVCGVLDCDDSDPGFNPGADDICEDGIDQNCDGADAICPCLDTDDDGDGFGDGLACSPVDCNDGDPTIYPGALELCDAVDQDCDTISDNGDAAVMCPPTTQVATTNCSGGDCYVATCNGGYYDVDGFYSTGCECMDESFGGTCGSATDFGDVNVGDSLPVDGVLPLSSSEDWIRVSFPAASGRPAAGTPTVTFTARPSADYYFDVYYNCSGSFAACGSGSATNRTDYSFVDDQSDAALGYSSNVIAGWPEDLYIRVHRTGGGPSCVNYQLTITR